MKKTLILSVSIIILIYPILSYSISIIPGVNGFGLDTPAGRGVQNPPKIKIYRVNTLSVSETNPILNSDGTYSGSLRGCLKHKPNQGEGKVIIFEVSGTIDLRTVHKVFITDNYLTIAGQTAPSPGITLKGARIAIYGNNILIQHLRIRIGDDPIGSEGSFRDGLNIYGRNIVIDHCSVSWALDENAGILKNPESSESAYISNITWMNSIISEGLMNPKIYDSKKENHGEAEPEHSCGMLISRGVERVSLIGNIFAHNRRRNPLIKSADIKLLFVNNIIYNFQSVGLTINPEYGDGPFEASIVGNAWIAGNDTKIGNYAVRIFGKGLLFVNDNQAPRKISGNDWSIVKEEEGVSNKVNNPPVWINGLKALSSKNVITEVLKNAGARPADRDAVDTRIINDVKKREGNLINSQDEKGGWPYLVENRRPLILPDNPSADDDKDGYTNLEEWLHKFSAQVEITEQSSPSVSVSPPNNLKIKK